MSPHTSLSVGSILSFTKNETGIADLELAEVVTKNATTLGFLSQAYGDRVEDPQIAQWFIKWGSNTPVTVTDNFSKFSKGPVTYVDVAFTSEPTKSIKAPITEILTATIQPGIDIDQFSQMTTKGLGLMDGEEGFFGASWGFALNDPSHVVIVAGWSSKEAHQAFANADSAKEFFGEWLGLVIGTSITQHHVHFKDFGSA